MRVYVTGAGGFLGRHVVAELRGRGHDVNGDFEAADALVHLAAWANAEGCERDPARAMQQNAVEALARAREWASTPGDGPMVLASTAAVYGPGDLVAPFLTEDEPASVYAASKLAAEHLCAAALGPRLSVLRMPPLYGPGQRFRARGVVARWMSLLAAGRRDLPVFAGADSEVRDYVYVADAARAVAQVVEGLLPRCAESWTRSAGGRPGPSHLLATGTSVTIAGLADAVCRAWGVEPNLRPEAPATPVPHPRHARYDPSVWAETPLAVGLAQTAAWWRSLG